MTKFAPRAEAPTIKVADIAYLRFTRRELSRAERYFLDFGLKVAARTDAAIYFRGVLPQHHCVIVEAGTPSASSQPSERLHRSFVQVATCWQPRTTVKSCAGASRNGAK